VRRYRGFVRLKASSYFLAPGDPDDLAQEGMVGLYKAVRDYRPDRESSSFRTFAELCITREVIKAVKAASRTNRTLPNHHVSSEQVTLSPTPAGAGGVPTPDGVNHAISTEDLDALVGSLSDALSELETRVLVMYLDGRPYNEVATRLGCDRTTIDIVLQRVKRKIATQLASRAAAD
jgi:RNA polymerase sporulation-specific sigma factor